MVRWIDGGSVLINDYSTVEAALRRCLRRSLYRHQIDLIELPYEPQPSGRDGIPTAAGNWMNFLRIGDLLIVPTFGMRGDQRALGILRDAYPGHEIQALFCRDLQKREGCSIV
jgi:agmatine/peptidylarginine deiminase